MVIIFLHVNESGPALCVARSHPVGRMQQFWGKKIPYKRSEKPACDTRRWSHLKCVFLPLLFFAGRQFRLLRRESHAAI